MDVNDYPIQHHMDHFASLSFKDLALLYDNDMALSTRDRIFLYGELLKEPLVRDDVTRSISDFKRQLSQDGHIRGLRLLHHVCEIDCFVPHTRHIYEDNQNVHSFVEETLRVANNIIQKYHGVYFRPFDHVFLDKIEAAQDFQGISLTQLFASIYNYIIRSDDREELIKRLHEEMDDSINLCLTGHVCRLVNVLRGFADVAATEMTGYDYQKAKIFHELNKRIDILNVDNILLEVEKAINELVLEVNTASVLKILKEYTMEDWKYNNNTFTPLR